MCRTSYFKILFFFFSFPFFLENCFADISRSVNLPDDSLIVISLDSTRDIFLSDSIKPHIHENKKLIAAILAFPFPFGMMGLHRIYLGTKPYIPFVYVGTVGGCFGILPLIDFITILTTKKEKIKNFEGSRKVFMWVR